MTNKLNLASAPIRRNLDMISAAIARTAINEDAVDLIDDLIVILAAIRNDIIDYVGDPQVADKSKVSTDDLHDAVESIDRYCATDLMLHY